MSGQQMPPQGAFCWNELATTDLGAATSFYKALLGWEIKEGSAPDGGMKYNEIVAGGRHVGGMFSVNEMCGEGGDAPQMPPHWRIYVAVDDVDASAAKAAELGGSVVFPPTDIPNVGRFCVINDPAGAAISLITLKGARS
ncbi:MAG TPA: VOC family protein [Pyrinomonadaceae bacterium]|nr:VOC family protein [Pyrinomonadaceae bacterium]